MSLISVIITAYNSEKYILTALYSVINQTYREIEIIVIDDGSTDQTQKLVLSVQDPRIRYFYQENKGQCAASNLGIAKAKGDYLKFLDSDDLLNAEHLQEQFNRLNGSTTSLASCAWGRFYQDNIESVKFVPESVWKDLNALDWIKSALKQPDGDMMGGWVWLIPKQLLSKAGNWDERLSINNDFDFSIRLILAADKILFTPNAKLYYRSGLNSSLSANISKKNCESAFLTTKLGCTNLLKADVSAEMRRICANRYQFWIYELYPRFSEIRKKFEAEIIQLGGSDLKIQGGAISQFFCSCFGWKITLAIRHYWYKIIK